jgi:hypothetical protein
MTEAEVIRSGTELAKYIQSGGLFDILISAEFEGLGSGTLPHLDAESAKRAVLEIGKFAPILSAGEKDHSLFEALFDGDRDKLDDTQYMAKASLVCKVMGVLYHLKFMAAEYEVCAGCFDLTDRDELDDTDSILGEAIHLAEQGSATISADLETQIKSKVPFAYFCDSCIEAPIAHINSIVFDETGVNPHDVEIKYDLEDLPDPADVVGLDELGSEI